MKEQIASYSITYSMITKSLEDPSPKSEQMRFCHFRSGYFNCQMLPDQFEQAEGTGLLRRETGDAVNIFLFGMTTKPVDWAISCWFCSSAAMALS